MSGATAPIVGYLLFGADGEANRAGRRAALLDALGRLSPTIEPDPPDGCWLDLRSGGKRPPPPDAVGAKILATAREWGCAGARLAITPTPGVARLVAARAGGELTILHPAEVAAFLAPIPVASLEVDEAILTRLALVGLRTLGAIAALPRGSLAEYLGRPGVAIERLARGEDDRPLAPLREPLKVTARRALDHALDDRATLVAHLGQLLSPCLDQLRGRGLGATRATLTLWDARDRKRVVAVHLAAPTVALARVLGPLRDALPQGPETGDGEVDHEGMGITALRVTLAAPRPLVGRQGSFLDVPTGRRGLLREGLAEARRRGACPIGYLRPVDPAHPLPERRYALDDEALPGDDQGWVS